MWDYSTIGLAYVIHNIDHLTRQNKKQLGANAKPGSRSNQGKRRLPRGEELFPSFLALWHATQRMGSTRLRLRRAER